MIPAATFHKLRTDWKAKTVAAETEARLLREQLEAAKKQPVAAAPPQQLATPAGARRPGPRSGRLPQPRPVRAAQRPPQHVRDAGTGETHPGGVRGRRHRVSGSRQATTGAVRKTPRPTAPLWLADEGSGEAGGYSWATWATIRLGVSGADRSRGTPPRSRPKCATAAAFPYPQPPGCRAVAG